MNEDDDEDIQSKQQKDLLLKLVFIALVAVFLS
jgi:hypothetical protein